MAIAADQAERIRGLRDRYGDEATLRAIMKTHTMIDVPYWEQQIEKRGSESAMVDFLGDMGIEPLPRTSVSVALPERLERRRPAIPEPATTGWEAIGEVTGPAYPVVRERIADPTVMLDAYQKYINVPLTKLGVKQRTAIHRGMAAMRRDMVYLPDVEEAKEIIEARNWKKMRELAIEGRFPTADELGVDYLSEQVIKLQSEYQGARLRGALGVLGYAVNDPSASWFRRGEIPNLVPTEFVAKHPKLALAPLAITAPLEEVAHIATHPERWPGIAVMVLGHKFVVAPASKAGLTWLATKYPKAATYDLLTPLKRFFKGKKITSKSVSAFFSGRADIVPEQYPELTPEIRATLARMAGDRKTMDRVAAALRKGKPIRVYDPGVGAAPTGAPAAPPTEAPVTARELLPAPYVPPVEVPPVPPAKVPTVKEVPPVPEVQQPITPAAPPAKAPKPKPIPKVVKKPVSRTVPVLPDKKALLTTVDKAIKKALPEAELMKDHRLVYPAGVAKTIGFKIDGGAKVVNTKEALTKFRELVVGTPETMTVRRQKGISMPKPVAANREKIGPLLRTETPGYFTDGRAVIKGKPPKSAKVDTTRAALSKDVIPDVLATPTEPAEFLYYAYEGTDLVRAAGKDAEGEVIWKPEEGDVAVSGTALGLYDKDNYPIAVFRSGDKYYTFDQFRLNVIKTRFPDAKYGIGGVSEEGGMLIAYIGDEPVAGLAATQSRISKPGEPIKRAVIKDRPPLEEMAREAGLLEAAVPEAVPPTPPAVPPVEEVVAPPSEVVPPPTEDTAALEALGYTDSQIRRLRPEASARVLSEKIPAGQVSVTSDGDIRLIPDQDMPSEKASAYPYKTADEQAADVKKDVSDSMGVEVPLDEAGFIRIPALKDFSELSDRFKTGVRTMLEPERDVVADVYGAIEKWRSESNKAGLYADWSKDLLYRMVSGKKVRLKKAPLLVSKAELEFIPRWIEEPAKYSPEFNNLPPQAQALARVLVKDFQDMWEIANKAGILEAWRENYIPHIWRDKESQLRRVLYPMGGRLGRGFRFAKQRKIDTIAKGEELGLHPVLDPVLLNSVYKYQLYRTIANRNLIETLSKMEREDGMPLIMGRPKKPDKLKVWENEYEWLNVPSLAKYMYVGEAGDLGMLVKMPAKADPEVAEALNNAFAPWASRSRVSKAYRLARGRIKRVIMYNPAIHGWNILSDTLDEVNFNPFAVAKVMRRGAQLYKNQDKLVEYAVDSGLAMQTSYSVAVDLRKELLEGADQLRGVLEPLGKLERWSDRMLWTNIVRHSQIGLFETLTRIIGKRHPDWTKELVGRTTATYVNSLYGTLPHTWMKKGLREAGSIFFFARNWTYSNIDLVVKAATLGRKGLGVKALPPEAQTEIGTRYIKHLIKGMAGLLGFANLTQLAFLVITNKLKEDGIIEGEPVPLHTTFSNEKGHWMDIDTGLNTKTGQRIYLVGPLFRYIRDYIGWATAPLKTLYNKLEIVLKTTIENVANYSVWQRQQIDKPGAPTWDRIKQRAKYFVESITPSAVYAKRPGRVKTTFEYFIPFAGTWIRRGAPGGRFTQLFFEFRAEHRYKQDKLDDQIDEALQSGDFAEAMTLMEGRYVSKDAIADRIVRFTSPLNYYWKTASREEKLLFLHHLKKYNYTSEDLFNAMAQERMAIENRGD